VRRRRPEAARPGGDLKRHGARRAAVGRGADVAGGREGRRCYRTAARRCGGVRRGGGRTGRGEASGRKGSVIRDDTM
jgi:hypothetical protein